MINDRYRIDFHRQDDDTKDFKWVEYFKDCYYDDNGKTIEPYPLYGLVPATMTEEELNSPLIADHWYIVNPKFVDGPSRAWLVKELKKAEKRIKEDMELQEELTKIINSS